MTDTDPIEAWKAARRILATNRDDFYEAQDAGDALVAALEAATYHNAERGRAETDLRNALANAHNQGGAYVTMLTARQKRLDAERAAHAETRRAAAEFLAALDAARKTRALVTDDEYAELLLRAQGAKERLRALVVTPSPSASGQLARRDTLLLRLSLGTLVCPWTRERPWPMTDTDPIEAWKELRPGEFAPSGVVMAGDALVAEVERLRELLTEVDADPHDHLTPLHILLLRPTKLWRDV